MQLTYKTDKLQKLCENPKYNKELVKKIWYRSCKEITVKNKRT